MAVRVVNNKTGETVSGKYAVVKGADVLLYSGCMPDKKGGLRGCGKRTVFPADQVTVDADNAAQEVKSL